MRIATLLALLCLSLSAICSDNAVRLESVASTNGEITFFNSDDSPSGAVSVSLNGQRIRDNVPLTHTPLKVALPGLKRGTNTVRLTAPANAAAFGSLIAGTEIREFALAPGQIAWLKIARDNMFDFKVAVTAPSNPDTHRTTLGPGEIVDMSCSPTGLWSLDGDGTLKSNKGTKNVYTAPKKPGVGTVYVYFPDGSSRQCTFTTIPPASLTFKSIGPAKGIKAKDYGVGMIDDVTVNPTTVSFINCEFKEDDCAATNITGFFAQFNAASPIFASHNPSKKFEKVNSQNIYGDTCAVQIPLDANAVTSLQNSSGGSFTFSIPVRYLCKGDSGAGTQFTTVDQVFLILPNGAMRVTKGDATITRAGPPF